MALQCIKTVFSYLRSHVYTHNIYRDISSNDHPADMKKYETTLKNIETWKTIFILKMIDCSIIYYHDYVVN